MQPGLGPGEMAQSGPGTLWPQPEGNRLKKTPLVVAPLAKAASLGVVPSPDGAFFNVFALAKMV
jgi:hypothetical protein